MRDPYIDEITENQGKLFETACDNGDDMADFALKYMNIFMKSSFFDVFAMVFTFLRFLHFFTRNRVCSKSTPRHRFYSCSGGCCKIWDSTIADQYSNT